MPRSEGLPPSELLAFATAERDLFTQVISQLKERDPASATEAIGRMRSLEALAASASAFPSPMATGVLGVYERGESSLVDSLCAPSGPGRLLKTPTRVVIGRALMVAKVQAYALLSLALGSHDVLAPKVKKAQLQSIFSLLLEDVYLACLDDPLVSRETRARIASALVSMWESRGGGDCERIFPAFASLWFEREKSNPVFGTMGGASELVLLSINLGDDWRAFIRETLPKEESLQAVEEFLFGLSFEDIRRVRSRLVELGLVSIDRTGLSLLLGVERSYAQVDPGDPRSMYSFYAARKEAARARTLLGVEGPKRTLEELYLTHLIVSQR